MSKLAIFAGGLLFGMFLTAFIMLQERDRKLELGPQRHRLQDNDEDWAPCEYLTNR